MDNVFKFKENDRVIDTAIKVKGIVVACSYCCCDKQNVYCVKNEIGRLFICDENNLQLLADNQRIVCAIHKDTKTLIDCRVAFMDFEKKELEHYLISCGFPKDELIFKELLVNCNEQTN